KAKEEADKIETALKAVNDASSAGTQNSDSGSTWDALNDNATVIGINLSGDFDGLGGAYKTAVMKAVYNNGTDYATLADVKIAFNNAVAEQKAKEEADKIETALKAVNDASSAGTQNSDSGSTWEALNDNATVIGIDLTTGDFNNLGSIYKTAVMIAVYNGGNDYTTLADVKNAFNNAVAAQKDKEAADKVIEAWNKKDAAELKAVMANIEANKANRDKLIAVGVDFSKYDNASEVEKYTACQSLAKNIATVDALKKTLNAIFG
ncbi:MAG: hypothetical protein MR409_09940, partial [Lachnospiraceae bacterium]|nr:hypothetical protein [Lachnospiraceae bacterium]